MNNDTMKVIARTLVVILFLQNIYIQYTQYYYIRHNNINNLQLLKNTALEKVCYIIHIQCFHLGIIYHVTLFMLPNLNTSFIAHVT